MMKNIGMIFLLCCSSFVLSGCWDRYELEERANILGLSIEIAEKHRVKDVPEVTHIEGKFPDNEGDTIYKVTAQLAVPGKIKLGPEGGGGQGSEKTAWVLETYGYTMKDAMANLQQQLAEKIYLGHLQIVVVPEELAEMGLTDITDFLRRDYEVRRTAWLIVSEGKASKVLEAAPPLETVPSLYLSDTLKHAAKFGKLPREYLGKYWVDVSDVGIDAVLPLVKVIDNNRILVNGLVYFNEEKMVGKMSPIEIGAFLAMKEKNPGGYSLAVSLGKNDGTYLVESLERKSKIKVDIKNGKPTAFIEVKIDAMIEEETQANNLNEETLKQVEKATNEVAHEIFSNLIKQLQEDQSDILGIGATMRALHPDYWRTEVKNEEKWPEIYKEMEIELTVEYSIKRSGMEWK